MNRRFVVFSATGFAILAAAFAVAQPPPPPPHGHDPMMSVLTADQRTQVKGWLDDQHQQMEALDVGGLHAQLHAAILADAPDEARIEDLTAKLEAAQAKSLALEVAFARKIATILSPEQRKKMREMPPHGPMHGPGGPPPVDR